MTRKLLLVSLLAMASAEAARGQTQNGTAAADPRAGATAAAAMTSRIDPDGSLGTAVDRTGNVHTIDGGRLAGTNLFHSFANFDLAAGNVARWVHSAGDPAAVSNVVNRVTGGNPSHIFGTLDSTAIPNADFYFINPAGIVFGEGAQVAVPAAAHFSTAGELRFADGIRFAVAAPDGSKLSVAAPQAFGFVGGAGDILMQDVENLADSTFLPGGGGLTLSAANIRMDNGFIGSSDLTLTAVGNETAAVAVDGRSSDSVGGAIELVNSWLQTWPGDCFEECLGVPGSIRLNAGTIDLNLTGVVAEFDSPVATGRTNLVSLVARDGATIRDGFILADGYEAADAGAVRIDGGGRLELIDTFVLTYTAGRGRGGTIAIGADEVSIRGGSIGSESYDAGDAGEIAISARSSLTLEKEATIASSAQASGSAGLVSLAAPTISIVDSLVSTETLGEGEAGSVAVTAGESLEAVNSTISSSTSGDGAAGAVALTGPRILLDGGSRAASEALEGSTGDAGTVSVGAGELVVRDGSAVSSSTFSTGNAGGVVARADTILIDGGSISSGANPGADGASGTVAIDADTAVIVIGGGAIATESHNVNTAGSVLVAAPAITVTGADSRISSANLSQEGGDAGTIRIDTQRPDATVTTVAEGGRISTNSLTGAAGDIELAMAPYSRLTLEGVHSPGVIETSSGPGTGGVIAIAGPLAIVSHGGSIRALGESGGANVQIGTDYFIASADRANSVEVSGTLVFQNSIYDVSAGTVTPDLSVLDASGVLRGQCPALRSGGQLSEFTARAVGPYMREAASARRPQDVVAPVEGVSRRECL